MLQRAISCLFVVFLSLSAVSAVYAEARGPKIFGFQVGMPWNEAVKVAKAYAEKHNLEIEESKFNEKFINCVYVTKGNNRYFTLVPSDHHSGGLLSSISFYPSAFNLINPSPEVYKKIFEHYDLSFDDLKQIGKFSVGYSDINEGFKVELFLTHGTWLSISMIEKQSDLNLE